MISTSRKWEYNKANMEESAADTGAGDSNKMVFVRRIGEGVFATVAECIDPKG